jgi:hypothetical protein
LIGSASLVGGIILSALAWYARLVTMDKERTNPMAALATALHISPYWPFSATASLGIRDARPPPVVNLVLHGSEWMVKNTALVYARCLT